MSNSPQILRLSTVSAMTGLPRSTLYHYIARGAFPKQLKIGPRAAGWIAAEVQAWIEERIARREVAA